MDITKIFTIILNGQFAAPFLIILLTGFVRASQLLLTEKDNRLKDSQKYNETITMLNNSLTKLETANQETNKLLVSKIDGFMDGNKR